jgi:beta-RFAP synthase
MRVRVRTGSRLHFGFMAGAAAGGRSFGGVGLMIDEPAVEIEAAIGGADSSPSDRSPDGAAPPIVERARRIRDQLAAEFDPSSERAPAIRVRSAPPEHVGLGLGTQLALAVGWGVLRLANRTMSLEQLACRLGRGRRSAIGIHGFAHGGLLVDGGRGAGTRVAPLVARYDFPEDWPILLIPMEGGAGWHSAKEEDAFQRLPPWPADKTARLSEWVLRRMAPAVLERDREAFCQALSDYNRAAGECFASVQGGPYAGPQTERLVLWLSQRGFPAAQSSWGPTVFCFPADFNEAHALGRDAEKEFRLPPGAALVATARNSGAEIAEEGI